MCSSRPLQRTKMHCWVLRGLQEAVYSPPQHFLKGLRSGLNSDRAAHLHQIKALHAVLHFFDELHFVGCFHLCELDREVGLLLFDWRVLLHCSLVSEGKNNQENVGKQLLDLSQQCMCLRNNLAGINLTQLLI